ncbi:MAG: hypothetical protein V1688_03240 [bacterium]
MKTYELTFCGMKKQRELREKRQKRKEMIIAVLQKINPFYLSKMQILLESLFFILVLAEIFFLCFLLK